MRVDELIDFNPKVKLARGEEYPFVEMSELPTRTRDVDGAVVKTLKSGGSKFEIGDTLFARITPCLENGKGGRVRSLPSGTKGFGSTEFIVMRAKKGLPSMLPYYVSRYPKFRKFAEKRMRGTSGRQRVSWQALSEFEVADDLASRASSICATLSALDDRIDLNRRMNATLEAQARALFRDWFVDFGPTRAKMAGATPYLPADLWALFPDTLGGGGLPKGWVHEPLSKHCRATRGLSYKGKHLTTSENGVQMYNLNSINEGGGIKASGMKYYDGPYKDRHAVEPGDLIMANTEQGFDHLLIGYSAIIDSPGISSHHLYAIRPLDCSSLTSQWLLYLFNCSPYGETVRRYSNGTTVNMLPADALSMPLIPVPPPSLMKAFTSVAQSSHDQINEARKLSERLAGVRDYLLPRLMSGETEVEA